LPFWISWILFLWSWLCCYKFKIKIWQF